MTRLQVMPRASRPKKLPKNEVARRLSELDGWKITRGVLRKTWTFDGFPAAMRFVQKTGRHAQRVDHHPDIDIRFSKVTLALVTHDVGGLTDSDFLFASRADQIFAA